MSAGTWQHRMLNVYLLVVSTQRAAGLRFDNLLDAARELTAHDLTGRAQREFWDHLQALGDLELGDFAIEQKCLEYVDVELLPLPLRIAAFLVGATCEHGCLRRFAYCRSFRRCRIRRQARPEHRAAEN